MNKGIEGKLNRYIFPNMLAMVGMSCYFLADTYFISVAAGHEGITALNLTLPLYGLIYAIGAMIAIGSATAYSLDKAAGRAGYKDFFSNSLMWIFLISLIFVTVGLTCPGPVFRLMGADSDITAMGLPYFRTVLLFAPAFMLSYTMTTFVRNDGAPGVAMAATLTSSLLNILMDYILMFPCGMGFVGAAVATGFSPLISSGICMIHYLSKRNSVTFIWHIPSVKKLARASSLGVAGFVGEISSGVIAFSFNYVLLSLVSNVGVAAYGIIANVSLVGISFFNGVAQGLQPMASEAGGREDTDMKKRVLRHSMIIGTVTAVIITAVCCIFTEGIVSVFNSEGSREMADYAVEGLRLYSIGFLPGVINIVRAGFFGAIGRAKLCSAISVSRGIIAIVVCVLLLPVFMGVQGVWLAFPAAELLTFVLSLFLEKRI